MDDLDVDPSESNEPVMPPVVYVPCAVDDHDERHAVLRYTNDGRIALPVYTALDRLHTCAGTSLGADGLGRLGADSRRRII